MLHFSGDTHGEHGRFRELYAAGEGEWTENDYLIISGDFGYLFKNDSFEHIFLNSLEKKPYTICFCDGNHENFDAISSYPIEEWNGGFIHRIRKNVIHLMRGSIFTIDGRTVFAMGGAYSTDRYMRTKQYSWWEEELPNDDEYKTAAHNLKAANYQVDYIVSHTAPREIIRRMGYTPDLHDMELTGFLEWVMYEVKYQQWFFGHFHQDLAVDEKHRALLFDVVSV